MINDDSDSTQNCPISPDKKKLFDIKVKNEYYPIYSLNNEERMLINEFIINKNEYIMLATINLSMPTLGIGNMAVFLDKLGDDGAIRLFYEIYSSQDWQNGVLKINPIDTIH